MIHIINRHCEFSEISKTKKRPDWFSRRKCFFNLIDTIDSVDCFLHILFDGNIENHFLKEYGYPIVNINAGTGSKSFLLAIDYALSLDIKDDDIIYFIEDDYMHRKNWHQILEEGIKLNQNGYVSLYDHADKYSLMYTNLTSQIIAGKLSHWRTTPSTTDTFAIRKKILEENRELIESFSKELSYSLDHKRCQALWENGIPLITSIPGYSTHCEPEYLSPTIDWSVV